MKKLCLLLLVLTAYHYSRAQDDDSNKPSSEESEEYHSYRLEITEPPYGLDKVSALIAKIKRTEGDNGDDGTEALDQKTYLSLSLREKFTYNMIHPESYSQNCDAMPAVQDEQKKIFGQLPDAFGEYSWSEHQSKFFLANKDSVMAWMRSIISKDNRVGLNFKQVMVDINAKEMIPFLINMYNAEKKDHDILTVLMLLMKDNEYDEFLVSLSYKKLYADKESSYKAYLNFNTANEELIIKRATNFYNELHK